MGDVDWTAEAAWYSDLIRRTPSRPDRDVIAVPDHPGVMCLYVPEETHNRLHSLLVAAGFKVLGTARSVGGDGTPIVTTMIRCTEAETLTAIVKSAGTKS